MTDLAQQNPEQYISLRSIADRQQISMKYLEAIMASLHAAGFVLSLRGKNGGYKLARSTGEYTVGSILKLTEGSLAPVTCLEYKTNTCNRSDSCVTLPMWRKLNRLIDEFLEGITIEDLIVQSMASNPRNKATAAGRERL